MLSLQTVGKSEDPVEACAKPILFIDFNGTLCYDYFWRSLEEDLKGQVQQFLFVDNKHIVYDWMRGCYTAEEVNTMVAEDLKVSFEELWSVFKSDCRTMNISEVVLKKINGLRSRYRTILSTDNMDSLDRFTIPALQLNRYFDVISNSYNEGKSKDDEDGGLFQKYIELYEADTTRSVLIDDSEKTCAIFEQLGGRALRVTPHQDLLFHLERLE